MNTHSSLSVADYILTRAKISGRSLTPMQLIKLVYLSHGWMLGLYNRPLLNEYAEAWQYGPVVRSLYGAVKKFRASPVIGPLSVGDEDFDDSEKSIMDQVVEIYKAYSGPQLSQLTHTAGTPWSHVWNNGGHYAAIPNELIADHYKTLAAQRTKTASTAV